jgi:hypothetical protein
MTWSPEFQRADRADGRVAVRLGHPVVDNYLEFLAAWCRPNTVLAACGCRKWCRGCSCGVSLLVDVSAAECHEVLPAALLDVGRQI